MYNILFPSSGADSQDENRPDKRDDKHKSTSGGASNVKVIAIFGLLIAAGVISGVVIYMGNSNLIVCQYYLKDPSVNFVERQLCSSFDCPFDVSACDTKCPFEYDFGPDECPQSCECSQDARRYQGDVVFGAEQLPSMLKNYGMLDEEGEGFSVRGFALLYELQGLWTQTSLNDRWQIAYSFQEDGVFDPEHQQLIDAALSRFQPYVCIDFVRRTTEKDYINFQDNNFPACCSYIGKQLKAQPVWVKHPDCTSNDLPLHEVMHTLGFQHEVNRPDRDDYIKVHFDNVKPNHEGAFWTISEEEFLELGIPFDVTSIMLHEGFALSIKPGEEDGMTITRIDNGLPTAAKTKVSEIDALNIRSLYKCKGSYSTLNPTQATDVSGLSIEESGRRDWAEWEEWNECTNCSEQSSRERKRKCIGAHPSYCELFHPKEKSIESIPCSDTEDCLKSSYWNDWDAWSTCASTAATATRKRYCIGGGCKGKKEESRPCTGQGSSGSDTSHANLGGAAPTPEPAPGQTPAPTPEPGPAPTSQQTLSVSSIGNTPSGPHWLEWNEWSSCFGSCDQKIYVYRTRKCSAGKDVNLCSKSTNTKSYEEIRCSQQSHCTQTAQWVTVSENWSECSLTCGGGVMRKERKCDGTGCAGESTISAACNKQECPPEGEKILKWEEWTTWTGCDNTCDSPGTATRTRSCDGGSAEECEAFYKDVSSQTRECELLPCTHAQWNEWQEWEKCSQTCGGGWKIRERICNQANKCEGQALGFEQCGTAKCTLASEWSQWTALLPCDKTCGSGGISVLQRTCSPNPSECSGLGFDVKACELKACPGGSKKDDMLDDEAAFSVFGVSKFTSIGDLCNSGSPDSWAFGDFNGDKVSDAACGKDSGTFTFALSGASQFIESVAWQGEMQDCKGEIKLSADFNGDGSDDLLCQDKKGRSLSVKLSNNGNFNAPATQSNKFCTGNQDVVLLADSNADKKVDILCHHEDSGAVELFVL